MKIDYLKLHPCTQEWLALYELLRRMKYTPDEIFFARWLNAITVEIHADGLEFAIQICNHIPHFDQVVEEFKMVGDAMQRVQNGGPEELDLDSVQKCIDKALCFRDENMASLIMALSEAGFKPRWREEGPKSELLH